MFQVSMASVLRRFSTMPCRRQIFKVLGTPATALEIALTPSQTATAHGGIVLATQEKSLQIHKGLITGPAQIVLGLPSAPVILQTHREKWYVRDIYIVASTEIDEQTVVAASNGVVRVDVPAESELVVEKTNVIGHTAGGTIVYRESRLDVLQTWLAWSWNATKDSLTTLVTAVKYGTNSGYRFLLQSQRIVSRLFSRFASKPTEKQLEPQTGPSLIEAQPKSKSSRFQLPPQIVEIYHLTSRYYRKAYSVVSAKLFIWTHKPKLRFVGPCSVLIKA